MTPGAMPPLNGFEAKSFKNSTPNEISELSRTAFHVMKTAVYNAEIGLRAQLSRAQPEPKRQFIPMPSNLEVVEHASVYEQPAPAPVADTTPAALQPSRADYEAWNERNAKAQPSVVPTQPEQWTILDEEDNKTPSWDHFDKPDDPAASVQDDNLTNIRSNLSAIYGEIESNQPAQSPEDNPHAA